MCANVQSWRAARRIFQCCVHHPGSSPMADLLNRIEHRWGRRFRVNIPVRAAVSSSEIECRLRNLSLSGALMKSEHDFRLNTLIEVIISLPLLAEGRAKVKAHVTRKLNEGVAIEWCEFAPHAVKELLRSPEVADAR
ncbi:MAG TPA: PilZ domain-containing protein [Steroidobacteraceae bacterium]|nr:PilZ domain-containing protein [Steroidobacteraceae bacterium]